MNGFAPSAPDMYQLWQWLSLNGLAVVALVNLAFFVCAVFLAIHALILSSRVRRIARAAERNATLLDKLMKEMDAAANRPPDGAGWREGPSPQVNEGMLGGGATDWRSEFSRMTKELEDLRREATLTRRLASERQTDAATRTTDVRDLGELKGEIGRLRTQLSGDEFSQPRNVQVEPAPEAD